MRRPRDCQDPRGRQQASLIVRQPAKSAEKHQYERKEACGALADDPEKIFHRLIFSTRHTAIAARSNTKPVTVGEMTISPAGSPTRAPPMVKADEERRPTKFRSDETFVIVAVARKEGP